jgi:UDP-N-acetylmuramyl pentapeptide phosphotransferase/UDP-N-acetylglucosamine-1-phosphate transferase
MPSIAFVAPLASAAVTALVIVWMLRPGERLPLDIPNQRSLHTRPTPRSGGIAMMAGIFTGLALLPGPIALVLSAGLLVAVSHLDDLYGLPVSVRLVVQLAACFAFAYSALAATSLPLLLLIVVSALWATNLYNFMDGSDGLAAGMTLLGFTFLGAGAWIGGNQVLSVECAIVAAAAAAFLRFNFPPARIFMGDAGSVPIGFFAVTLSLTGWHDGAWPLWFPGLVFAPFIADATLTLVKRVLAGERPWEAHNKHYYQRLVRLGWNHRRVALTEYALIATCGATALWALGQPLGLQLAAVSVLVALHATLAFWVDSAWRRSNGNFIGPI